MDYYKEWHHPVLRELVRLDDFVPDPEAIAARLYHDMTAEKVRRSLALLETLDLVAVDRETGRLHVRDGNIVLATDEAAAQLVIARCHQAMIDAAKEAVAKVPDDQAEYNALTLSLSYDEFEELRGRIRSFCQEVMARDASQPRRECVAQLNVQLFSLTRWKGRS
jgi:uncharacterized protein (TIGR02147 family)